MNKITPGLFALLLSCCIPSFGIALNAAQPEHWDKSSPGERRNTVDELLRAHHLIGVTSSEIRDLLGRPDVWTGDSPNCDHYSLTAIKLKDKFTSTEVPVYSLDIQFQNGVVSRYRLTNRQKQPHVKVTGGDWNVTPDLKGWTKNQWVLNQKAIPFNQEEWTAGPNHRLSMLADLTPTLLGKTSTQVEKLLGKPDFLDVESGVKEKSYELSASSCATGGNRRLDLQFVRGKLQKMRVATHLTQFPIVESGNWIEQ